MRHISTASILFDVAIIGAGASGTLTALNFARLAPHGARAVLIEAGARAARGLAYGTPYGAHLLNVPAGRMSALADEPDHFLSWLRGRMANAHAGTFAPRALYGDYLATMLAERDAYDRVIRVGGTAVGLTRDGREWMVHLHDDRIVTARAVVLALGNLPPSDPLRLRDAPPEYIKDPWSPGANIELSGDAPVLLIGTGLTAVDVAIAMRTDGHKGPIYALSRNGRLPQVHATTTPLPLASVPEPLSSPRGALRYVRRRVAEGDPWRAVVDSLRPHTATIWRRWTLSQRASFIRHLRNLWDVHRHRAAPEVHGQLDVQVLAGRLLELSSADEGIDVVWRPSRVGSSRVLRVARVINCTGPASDYAQLELPLVVQLRRAGWLVPDPLRLGVETDRVGQLLGTDGLPVAGLFTLGPLRRPALWESTAIPEIREQAAALARVLSPEATDSARVMLNA